MSDDIFTMPVPAGQADERCSFCDKTAAEVERLIYADRSPSAGRAAICNECVTRYHTWLTPART